ncbi:hypothetical protein GCM10009716_22060 [Streptomyces sodiiphilus]|uniref:Tetracyclin repressor-like C-terminal group 31 domain-containing protein n=1 Tax=Streptomyces sodiiphilus TaxID=226217 RepID=A0ABN2P3Q9_9ACTN
MLAVRTTSTPAAAMGALPSPPVRADLRADLTRASGAGLGRNIRFHLDAGLPGGTMSVLLLYLAMRGLIVDDLTVPEVLARYPLDDLIGELVRRVLPPDTE